MRERRQNCRAEGEERGRRRQVKRGRKDWTRALAASDAEFIRPLGLSDPSVRDLQL